MTASTTTKIVGSFGRLWGRGHETFDRNLRRILSVQGTGATTYLQGLVTCDLTQPPTPPTPEPISSPQPGLPKRMMKQEAEPVEFSKTLWAGSFLDHKGRLVTDSLVWKMNDEHYYIDCPGSAADLLLQHLKQYKLRRSKVTIQDATEQVSNHVVFGTLNAQGAPPGFKTALDPRHPSLGMRVLGLPDEDNHKMAEFTQRMAQAFPDAPGNYELVRRLVGVAEGAELTGKIALETNQEFLHSVSFHKGCYLGQELTARVHHTGAVRKRVMPILVMDPNTQVPQAWKLASGLQQGHELERFTQKEQAVLPSRLPRLSVLTAGNLVAVTTGSIEPSQPAVDDAAQAEWDQMQKRMEAFVASVQESCTAGAKLVDFKSGKTVGQVLSPPVPGTNVVLALMRLESVGLMKGGTWSDLNKVKIGNGAQEFRYLPYLPLWWPELDPETGKAKEKSEDEAEEEDELRDDQEETKRSWRLPRIEFEEVPLTDEEKSSESK